MSMVKHKNEVYNINTFFLNLPRQTFRKSTYDAVLLCNFGQQLQ